MDTSRDRPHRRPMTERSDDIPLRRIGGRWRASPRPADLAASFAVVTLAGVLAHAARALLPASSLMLFFLVAVLVSAVRFGFWTGIAASALSFLAYDFFFVEPLHTLRVTHAEDVLALAVMLFAGGITGLLAGRMREQTDAANARAAMLVRLGSFAADLGKAESSRAIGETMVRHLAAASDGAAILLEPDGGRLARTFSVPADLDLEPADREAAARVGRRGVSDAGTARGWQGSHYVFHPLARTGAVVGFRPPGPQARGFDNRRQVLDTIVAQAVVALERAQFAADATRARSTAERESLRAALLSSLSHDLKTPLATIVGSVTSLRQLGDALPERARADLLLAIEQEAGRLSRYVSDLLDMTRLRAGIAPRTEWVDVVDVAHGALERARGAHPGRSLVFDATPGVPLVRADAGLLEQALFNVMDNAVKFSPVDQPVLVRVAREEDAATIVVSDRGPGITPGDIEHVFEPFFRGGGGQVAGTGLGLAIARGIVQVLGGTIGAESPAPDGPGTRMVVRLALPEAAAS